PRGPRVQHVRLAITGESRSAARDHARRGGELDARRLRVGADEDVARLRGGRVLRRGVPRRRRARATATVGRDVERAARAGRDLEFAAARIPGGDAGAARVRVVVRRVAVEDLLRGDDLLEIRLHRGHVGLLARLAELRDRDGGQDADDHDHDQQLDEREALPVLKHASLLFGLWWKETAAVYGQRVYHPTEFRHRIT